MTKNFDLTPHNTMQLISTASGGSKINSLEDIEALRDFAKKCDLPFYVIGGGSNLIPHEHVEAIVGIMAMKGREIRRNDKDGYVVSASAGEDWSEFVEWTVAQGIGGLENLAGIPGTVGAAPIQNIGAYGVELKDRFHSLEAYNCLSGEIEVFSKDKCQFSYRNSFFKNTVNHYIVLKVNFELPRMWRPIRNYAGLEVLPPDATLEVVKNRVLSLRQSKLPDWRALGNSGSFFHNPIIPLEEAQELEGAPKYPQPDGQVKVSAAWLIEKCGLKGYRDGPVGVYDHHALILVNHGGARFSDIERLAKHVQSSVYKRFGISLIQEPLEI